MTARAQIWQGRTSTGTTFWAWWCHGCDTPLQRYAFSVAETQAAAMKRVCRHLKNKHPLAHRPTEAEWADLGRACEPGSCECKDAALTVRAQQAQEAHAYGAHSPTYPRDFDHTPEPDVRDHLQAHAEKGTRG